MSFPICYSSVSKATDCIILVVEMHFAGAETASITDTSEARSTRLYQTAELLISFAKVKPLDGTIVFIIQAAAFVNLTAGAG